MMGYGWSAGSGMWILTGLFWFAVVALAVWAALTLAPQSRRVAQRQRETAEEILDRRFALGELDPEQYRQIRTELAADRR